MTLQIESLTATLSGPLSALANGQIGTLHAFVFSGRSACTCGLSPVLSDLLHAHRRYLRSTLVFIYPLCKRVTHWPQAVLGAAFNWGMLMSWAQVAGHIRQEPLLMWIGPSHGRSVTIPSMLR